MSESTPQPPPLPNEKSSFSARVREGVSTLAASAKDAAKVTAKQAEKTKITQISLPSAYHALGKHIHSSGKFRDEFGELYASIDDGLRKIDGLKEVKPTEGEQKFSDKAKAAAQKAKDGVTAKTLSVAVDNNLRNLGRGAYEKYGVNAGSPELIHPIADLHDRLGKLAEDIKAVEAAHQDQFLTPKRLLIGVGGIAALVLVVIVASLFRGGAQQHAVPIPDFSDVDYSVTSPDPPKTDFAEGPNGEQIVKKGLTWPRPKGAMIAHGFVRDGEFVLHGEAVIYYTNGSRFDRRLDGIDAKIASVE